MNVALTVGLVVLIVVQVVTLGATGWAIHDAVRDWRDVVAAGVENGRRLYARAAVRHEWTRLAQQALLTVVAWMLLARSVASQGGAPSTWAVVVIGLFTAGQLLTAYVAVDAARVRAALNRRTHT